MARKEEKSFWDKIKWIAEVIAAIGVIAGIGYGVGKWQSYIEYKTILMEKECYSASLDEIERKGWSLVPSKHIEFKNRDAGIDFDARMRELQSEMRELMAQEEESKEELQELFGKLGDTL